MPDTGVLRNLFRGVSVPYTNLSHSIDRVCHVNIKILSIKHHDTVITKVIQNNTGKYAEESSQKAFKTPNNNLNKTYEQ